MCENCLGEWAADILTKCKRNNAKFEHIAALFRYGTEVSDDFESGEISLETAYERLAVLMSIAESSDEL